MNWSEGKKRSPVATIKIVTIGPDAFITAIKLFLVSSATARSLDVYQALRTLNPSPYMFYIDLGRNDVGRVAKTDSVRVTDNMIIERYSHVMHIVSQVEGELADGLTTADAIRSSFSAGTLSGSPKIRAMEIINELEPVRRNVYAGAVGYLSWHDDTDLAIAIRTAVIKDGMLHVQAGSGIVADSDPQKEWEGTMDKGRALIAAVISAAAGL